jgi:RNA polymerase sigma-70 factor (ECF subfamily)
VRALGGPAADVEDLVQEVFVVVERKLADFDGRNLAGWLYRITQRTVSDYRRRAWFRGLFLRNDVVLEDLSAAEPSSHELYARKEEQRRFYRLVGQMNARWRETFVLFEVAGYSGEEIAELTNLPHATVRTHLARARKEFLGLVAKGAE